LNLILGKIIVKKIINLSNEISMYQVAVKKKVNFYGYLTQNYIIF